MTLIITYTFVINTYTQKGHLVFLNPYFWINEASFMTNNAILDF